MSGFHHRKLPNFSTVLSGQGPIPDEFGFRSAKLQIWYNHTDEPWVDERAHAHRECDECFLVMKGSIVVDVDGEEVVVGPREFCFFPVGLFHRIVEVHPPVETFMIRAPSVRDKEYR